MAVVPSVARQCSPISLVRMVALRGAAVAGADAFRLLRYFLVLSARIFTQASQYRLWLPRFTSGWRQQNPSATACSRLAMASGVSLSVKASPGSQQKQPL